MSWQLPTEGDLLKACAVLFGSELDLNRDFLYYIQPSGVKSAYRCRARQTHPDMHRADPLRTDLNERFIEANNAYEQLLDFVMNRDRRVLPKENEPGFRHHAWQARARTQHTCKRPNAADTSVGFYKGSLPRRRLLFGQYLFYSGAVSWEALIKAVIWQRRQRPRIGDIALKNGLLNERQIKSLLNARRLGEQTGEAALRLKFLSRAQLHYMLSIQQRMQLPFGEYFVREKHLTRVKLFKMLAEFEVHNRPYQAAPVKTPHP